MAKALVDMGFTTEEKNMKGIGVKATVPYFTSLEGLYTAESANIIYEELSRRLQVVTLFKIDNVVTVAMVKPMAVTPMISTPQIATVKNGLKSSRLKADEITCSRISAITSPPTLPQPPEGATPPRTGARNARRRRPPQ